MLFRVLILTQLIICQCENIHSKEPEVVESFINDEVSKSHHILPRNDIPVFGKVEEVANRAQRSVELEEPKDKPRSEKQVSEKAEELSYSPAREIRGVTKEQWIKQPYPVDYQSRKEDNTKDQDSAGSNPISARAPRVHFVTNQKRFDTAESKVRQTELQSSTNSPRTTRMFDQRDYHNYDYRDRRPKFYMDRDYNQYDLDPPRYTPAASRYNEYELENMYKPRSPPKKRIIYYTTLPEVVRTPPNVDLHYRSPPPILSPPYNDYYMKRYHDGRVTSSPVAVADNNYNFYDDNRFDDGYRYAPPAPPPQRPPTRYLPNMRPFHSAKDYDMNSRPSDDRRPYAPDGNNNNKERMVDSTRPEFNRPFSNSESTEKTPYPPVKISTGVNVKENDLKVPERRIYADRQREYVYALPSFQLTDDESYNSSPYYSNGRYR